MDFFDPVYIIRDAGFGRDFTPKFWSAIICVGLVLWDMRTQRRLDYLWVFITGSVLWGSAEAFLSFQGIREMPERVMFGHPLQLGWSYVVQGMAEGALVAVGGLFLADRFLCKQRRGRAWILVAAFVAAIVLSTFRSGRNLAGLGEAASRRNVLDTRALLFLLVVSALAVFFYVVYREWRPRTMAMFVMMLVIGASWAIAQVSIQGRWVEVASADGGFQRAPALVAIGALTFDVVVEIALIYVPFLAIPVMVRLMRDPRPLPTCSDSVDVAATPNSAV